MRLKSVSDKPKKGILTGSGPLIASAIAAVMLLSLELITQLLAQGFSFRLRLVLHLLELSASQKYLKF